VNKITDASNNAINYIYNEDNTKGEYTLQRINYGNNSAAQSLTMDLPCASILESSVLPYSKVCPLLVSAVQ
jgi:hypothetical protein